MATKLLREHLNNFESFIIEARYFGDGTDPLTTVDLCVTKARYRTHEEILIRIQCQLQAYDPTNFVACAELMDMVCQGTQYRVVRYPDTALVPKTSLAGENPVQPRLIVELEFYRSLEGSQQYCCDYFQLIPQLRALLLLKIFRRGADRTFACLAILYRRVLDSGEITVADVVSFGSTPLSSAASGRPFSVATCHFLQRVPELPLDCQRSTVCEDSCR